MSDGSATLDRIAAAASAVIAQIPWLATVTGTYNISLYQPAIYRGKELFLVAPLMVAVMAVWCVLRYRGAMWGIFVAFCLMLALVYWIYTSFPVESPLHAANWILSYCVFALFVAALGNLLISFRRETGA
jgi:hypothetical protein